MHASYRNAYHYHASRPDSHSLLIGYLAWALGIFGAHRFYYGRPLTGILWLLTGGVFLIGWIVDFFLIPNLDRAANHRYFRGHLDYSLCWVLLAILGAFGVHRFYMGKWISGIVYLCTLGLFGLGIIYDVLTLNDQISAINYNSAGRYAH